MTICRASWSRCIGLPRFRGCGAAVGAIEGPAGMGGIGEEGVTASKNLGDSEALFRAGWNYVYPWPQRTGGLVGGGV